MNGYTVAAVYGTLTGAANVGCPEERIMLHHWAMARHWTTLAKPTGVRLQNTELATGTHSVVCVCNVSACITRLARGGSGRR